MECDIGGLSVYYEVYGEGRPFLAVHGFGPDRRLMAGCMEPVFSDTPGYQRIYIDLPGMGKTKGAKWIRNSSDMLLLLEAFIEYVIPGKNLLLAGESYGGYLARGLVRHMPQRIDGVMLLCPVIIPEREKRAVPPHTVMKRDEALMSRLLPEDRESFEEDCVIQSERVYGRYKDEILPGLSVADKEFLEKLRADGYGFSFDPDDLSEPFAKPSLFLHGRQDSAVGFQDAWPVFLNYTRATFAVLDFAGHNLQIEQEGLFNALVKEWLERVG